MQGAPWPGAVAVSGGGDSVALMFLLADWARRAKSAVPPVVLIVDHRLRKGSAPDAKKAAGWARDAGLESHVLVRKGAVPKGDVEAAAREARYRLMGEWCRAHGRKSLCVAHTLEDQAETFLLRLARGSGLDGLCAMRPRTPLPGFDAVTLVRPLLDVSRAELRTFLRRRGQDWLEDPMNGDPRFARVRMRGAAPALAELGLTPGRLAATAAHLGRARAALEHDVESWLSEACRIDRGRALLDGLRLVAAPGEVGLRVLAHVLGQISGQPYRPRFERLLRLYQSIRCGSLRGQTLHGCRIGKAARRDAIFGPGTLTIMRETGRKSQVPD